MNDIDVLQLEHEGQCDCGQVVPQGGRAGWHRQRGVVICADCLDGATECATIFAIAGGRARDVWTYLDIEFLSA